MPPARWACGTAGTAPPTAWSEPDHVQELLDGRVDELRCFPRKVTLAFTGSPEELFTTYRSCFGPVLAARAALADDPARLEDLDRELLEFLRGEKVGAGDGSGQGRYEFEYLAVTATRR